jgi:hypothetical protein
MMNDRENRKAKVGDQMIEERGPYRFVFVCDEYQDDMTFDEAVLRASAGERLWTPWF